MVLFGSILKPKHLLKALLVVLGSFNCLSLLTLLRRPRAFWRLSQEMFAAFNKNVRNDPIPESTMFEILGREMENVQIDLFVDQEPTISFGELMSICVLTRLINPKNVLEIGTFRGVTTYHIAKNSDRSCRIYTMDLPDDYRAVEAINEVQRGGKAVTDLYLIDGRPRSEELCYVGTDVEHKITQISCDSTTYDYDKNFTEKFDLIFIDGSHEYEHVKIDSANAFKWSADGGVVLWHDYGLPVEITRGVKRHLRELRKIRDIRRLSGTSLCIFRKSE